MSLCDTCPKAGVATRIVAVFRDGSGEYLTGLTPTVRIRCQSGTNAGKYLKSDGTWTTTPSTEYTMSPTSADYLPGHYYLDWTPPAGGYVAYDIRVDGGATAADRHQDARVEAVAVDESDLASGPKLLDGTTTWEKALQVLLAGCCGKVSATGNKRTFKALDGTGTTARLEVTYGTADGERTAAEIDPA